VAQTYVTSEGDQVDDIAARYYGSTSNLVVEQVLEANPGLADYGPTLPAGLRLVLPDIARPAQTQGVRLWD
jgi:phage tail protein X